MAGAQAQDRLKFKNAMLKIGLDLPQSGVAHTIEEARAIAEQIGTMPLIIRPAYTLGGTGGGIAYNKAEFIDIIERGLDYPVLVDSAGRVVDGRNRRNACAAAQLSGELDWIFLKI